MTVVPVDVVLDYHVDYNHHHRGAVHRAVCSYRFADGNCHFVADGRDRPIYWIISEFRGHDNFRLIVNFVTYWRRSPKSENSSNYQIFGESSCFILLTISQKVITLRKNLRKIICNNFPKIRNFPIFGES